MITFVSKMQHRAATNDNVPAATAERPFVGLSGRRARQVLRACFGTMQCLGVAHEANAAYQHHLQHPSRPRSLIGTARVGAIVRLGRERVAGSERFAMSPAIGSRLLILLLITLLGLR